MTPKAVVQALRDQMSEQARNKVRQSLHQQKRELLVAPVAAAIPKLKLVGVQEDIARAGVGAQSILNAIKGSLVTTSLQARPDFRLTPSFVGMSLSLATGFWCHRRSIVTKYITT